MNRFTEWSHHSIYILLIYKFFFESVAGFSWEFLETKLESWVKLLWVAICWSFVGFIFSVNNRQQVRSRWQESRGSFGLKKFIYHLSKFILSFLRWVINFWILCFFLALHFRRPWRKSLLWVQIKLPWNCILLIGHRYILSCYRDGLQSLRIIIQRFGQSQLNTSGIFTSGNEGKGLWLDMASFLFFWKFSINPIWQNPS